MFFCLIIFKFITTTINSQFNKSVRFSQFFWCFYDQIWTQIIFNFNPWQNFESRYMYIWPILDGFDPRLTSDYPNWGVFWVIWKHLGPFLGRESIFEKKFFWLRDPWFFKSWAIRIQKSIFPKKFFACFSPPKILYFKTVWQNLSVKFDLVCHVVSQNSRFLGVPILSKLVYVCFQTKVMFPICRICF